MMGALVTQMELAALVILICLQISAGSSTDVVTIEYFRRVARTFGSVAAMLNVSSASECLLRCREFEKLKGFLFMSNTHTNNCVVISCCGEEPFVSAGGNVTFTVEVQDESSDPDAPVVYLDFEEIDQCWTTYGGAQFVSDAPPFSSDTTVVRVNHTQDQWVDLGEHSHACIAVPDTCGTQGGTLSVWVRVHSCKPNSAVIGSASTKVPQTSFTIQCIEDRFRYGIYEKEHFAEVVQGNPGDWVYAVMVYHGVGQSITIYHDGTHMADGNIRDNNGSHSTRVRGNGQVLIGKRVLPCHSLYSTADVDEVKMFNRRLTAQEIQNMY